MPPTPDHQLGVDLRLRWAGGPLGRQRLESMVRDLVGADQSLLAPLLHLVGQPAFLALDPREPSLALRLISRDRLLRQLEDTYQPRLLARLQQVLDGYLELETVAAGSDPSATPERPADPWQAAPTPTPTTPTPGGSTSSAPADARGGIPATASHPEPTSVPPTELVDLPVAPPVTAAPDPSPPSPPADPASSSSLTATTRPATRLRPWLGAALLGGTLLLAAQAPWVCRSLGLCPAAPPAGSAADRDAATPSSRALAAAEKAAAAMRTAGSLATFERALSDLDRELLRLSGDPLSSSQQQQRQRLQSVATDGQQRLRQERQQAETISQASSRLEALPSLPPDRQEPERASIRQSLEAIPSQSFSHGTAREQLGRLTPVAPASPPAPEPTPEAPSPAPAPPPAPEPAPAPPPAPAPRQAPSPGGNRWDSGGWSPPPRRQAPAPAEPDDGLSGAPPRDEPLF